MRVSSYFTTTVLALTLAATPALAQQITGAGATFPAPVYAKWGEAAKAAIGIELNEDVELFRNGAVDLIEVAQARLSSVTGCKTKVSPTSPAREFRKVIDWALGPQFVH